jgi:hypothetical protein
MRFAVLFAWALAAGQAAVPPRVQVPGTDIVVRRGWRLSIADGCRSAVPMKWRTESRGVFSSGAGWRMTVSSVPIANWNVYRFRMRAGLDHAATVHEDSERRLWIESRSEGALQHYVAVNAGARACVGVLDIPRDTQAGSDLIPDLVDAIDAAPRSWPPSEDDGEAQNLKMTAIETRPKSSFVSWIVRFGNRERSRIWNE